LLKEKDTKVAMTPKVNDTQILPTIWVLEI